MNIVDSCGWLEYFADGSSAGFFADAIEDIGALIVPSICIYEVFRRVAQQRGENDALRAIAMMRQGEIVDLVPLCPSTPPSLACNTSYHLLTASSWQPHKSIRLYSGLRIMILKGCQMYDISRNNLGEVTGVRYRPML